MLYPRDAPCAAFFAIWNGDYPPANASHSGANVSKTSHNTCPIKSSILRTQYNPNLFSQANRESVNTHGHRDPPATKTVYTKSVKTHITSFKPLDNKSPDLAAKPAFKKIDRIIGNSLVFRNASPSDAEFILSLRLDSTKGKHLSATPPELSKQIDWLERYKNDESQMYFVILEKNSNLVGTVRLYDKHNDSFCWGSWIIKNGSPNHYSIESALMVYQTALRLGFNNSHFDVRKGNVSVWRFHERFGAVRISESTDDYMYQISREAINNSLNKYKKYLPKDIEII